MRAYHRAMTAIGTVQLPPFRLTTLDQRESLFAHAGADAMVVFEFGAARGNMPPASL